MNKYVNNVNSVYFNMIMNNFNVYYMNVNYLKEL